MTPAAVIFDCDGTLVDSEPLAAQVFAEALGELGVAFTAEEALSGFRGRRMAACLAHAEQLLGRPLPDHFEPALRDRTASAFRTQLRAIEGAASLLGALTLPFCVASNAPREKTEFSLRLTGLRRFFGDRVFSAYEVGSWKPDPGLFLHAAAALRAAPGHCLVVEDSEAGVTAGIAAGMQVVALVPDGRPAWLPDRVPALQRLRDILGHL